MQKTLERSHVTKNAGGNGQGAAEDWFQQIWIENRNAQTAPRESLRFQAGRRSDVNVEGGAHQTGLASCAASPPAIP